MNLTLYLIFTFIAFISLIIGLLLKNDVSKGIRIAMLMLPAIIFTLLAYSSFNIEIPACANQINSSTAQNTSYTTYTSNITCETTAYKESDTAILFSLLALFSLIIAFLRAFTSTFDIFDPGSGGNNGL
jgi:hypothetical protein